MEAVFIIITLFMLFLVIAGAIAISNNGRGIDADPLLYGDNRRFRFLQKARKTSTEEKNMLIMQKWGSILSLSQSVLDKDVLKAALYQMFEAVQDVGLDNRNVADFLIVFRPANGSYLKVKLPNGELVAFKYDVVTHRLTGAEVKNAYGPLRQELANSLRLIMEAKGIKLDAAMEHC